MPLTVQERVQQELNKLVGLALTVTRRAVDLRFFYFGNPDAEGDGMTGNLVLNVQCPWRIEGADGVLTGRPDFWWPAEELTGDDLLRWDCERDANLQDRRMAEWLIDPGRRTGPRPSTAYQPVVLAVRAMPFGGAEIDLSGGYRLTLFPAGSDGDDWWLFRAGDRATPIFNVGCGRIEDRG